MENKIEDLKRKRKKLIFRLGDLIHKLYEGKVIRLLYTSGGMEHEKEVKKILRFLNYIDDRIKILEGAYSEGSEVEEERKALDEEGREFAGILTKGDKNSFGKPVKPRLKTKADGETKRKSGCNKGTIRR